MRGSRHCDPSCDWRFADPNADDDAEPGPAAAVRKDEDGLHDPLAGRQVPKRDVVLSGVRRIQRRIALQGERLACRLERVQRRGNRTIGDRPGHRADVAGRLEREPASGRQPHDGRGDLRRAAGGERAIPAAVHEDAGRDLVAVERHGQRRRGRLREIRGSARGDRIRVRHIRVELDRVCPQAPQTHVAADRTVLKQPGQRRSDDVVPAIRSRSKSTMCAGTSADPSTAIATSLGGAPDAREASTASVGAYSIRQPARHEARASSWNVDTP